MTLMLNTALQNLMADAVADDLDGATLTIYTGSAPASANDSATGTTLAVVTLPTPAMGDSAAGVSSKSGTWEDPTADATGTAGYFRIVTTGGRVIQGSITATSGGGDMELDSVSLTAGDTFTVTSFTWTQPAS